MDGTVVGGGRFAPSHFALVLDAEGSREEKTTSITKSRRVLFMDAHRLSISSELLAFKDTIVACEGRQVGSKRR